MESLIAKFLELREQQGFLAYSQLNDDLPDDAFDPNKLHVGLPLREKQGIALRHESQSKDRRHPSPEQKTFRKCTPEELKSWKSYPIRISGPRLSRCHAKPTLLVQSMKGGFITANCSECGDKDTINHTEFLKLPLWVSCPRCKKQMARALLSRIKGNSRLAGNYGFACSSCSIYLLLADLLPYWDDLM